jgi:hypothetical protein
MARKSKAAKKSARKTAPSKLKSKPRRGRAAPLALKIGVVSSIQIPPRFRNALRSSVKDELPGGAADFVFRPNVGYDPAALGAAINAFATDATIGLIVTFGGLITFQAANNTTNNPSKPFISLIGGTPPGVTAPGTGNFFGAVSLESYTGNPTRLDHLEGIGYGRAQVTLLYNQRSGMSAEEVRLWSGGPIVNKDDNDPTTYTSVFNTIQTRAVIVSSDPFFHDTREQLIAAANASGKYMCYPLYDYRNRGGTMPARGRATLQGPRLREAIVTLGDMAAEVLVSGAPAEDAVIRVGRPVDL